MNFKLVPANYNYSGGGLWAEPDKEHLLEIMRDVYKDREKCRHLGRKASRLASAFTWEQSNAALAQVMRDIGMPTAGNF